MPRWTSSTLAAWHEALRLRVKLLAAAMRDAAERHAFLVAATRLGGHHGYDAPAPRRAAGRRRDRLHQGLKRERPDALVKAVDFEPEPQDRRARRRA